ncbi:hypothetical protein, partial [Streptomyces sp. SID6137]|uniref:hypothetical protein n=1 Tax=Streptomyces sp. SID6137 TaxID=2690319 RepID=UPI0013818070|nr:hypothetical protein [Streptomyces sp. SID6137]
MSVREPADAVTDTLQAGTGTGPRRGAWRAQAGSRLIAPLRPVLIAAGVAQVLVTFVQLAPFVL